METETPATPEPTLAAEIATEAPAVSSPAPAPRTPLFANLRALSKKELEAP